MLHGLSDTLPDLDHRGAQIFKHINPLSIPTIILKPPCTTNAPSNAGVSFTPASSPTIPENKILTRVGLSLQQILKNEYGDAYTGHYPDPVAIMERRNPLLAGIDPMGALSRLKSELKQYAKGEEPFNRRFRDGQTVLSWWTFVQKDEFAHVLGVCLGLTMTLHSLMLIILLGSRYQNLFSLCSFYG
jgi:hypothetical protein